MEWLALQHTAVLSANANVLMLINLSAAAVTQSSGEAEVDEFDLAAGLVDTHDVFGFEVQVDDALFVDEVDSVDDLQHVFDHFPFCQLEVLVDDPLKELATWDPAQQKQNF